MSDTVPIKTRDFWVKIVEMLQQNLALIELKGSKVNVVSCSIGERQLVGLWSERLKTSAGRIKS